MPTFQKGGSGRDHNPEGFTIQVYHNYWDHHGCVVTDVFIRYVYVAMAIEENTRQ
jgi:hypothetical protein